MGKAALEKIDEKRYPRVVAALLRALIQTSPRDEALAFAKRAIPLYERIGDGIGVAVLHIGLSREYRLRGLLEKADAANARAGELFASNDASRSQFYVALLDARVWLRIEQSRYEEALAAITEGTAVANALGDHEAFKWALNRAELDFAMGRTEAAIHFAEEVAERALESGADHSFWAGRMYASVACFRASKDGPQGGYIAARTSLMLARNGHRSTAAEPILVMALIAASRADTLLAARLLGAIETLEGARLISLPESMTKGGGGVVRQLLIASLNEQLSPQELENLKAQGASYAWDVAVAEALKIESL
jgi:tetratricopeptide (TPR) repeat protein